MLQARWERSQKRKKLLAQTVSIEIYPGRKSGGFFKVQAKCRYPYTFTLSFAAGSFKRG